MCQLHSNIRKTYANLMEFIMWNSWRKTWDKLKRQDSVKSIEKWDGHREGDFSDITEKFCSKQMWKIPKYEHALTQANCNGK